jgi:hypothetical protein
VILCSGPENLTCGVVVRSARERARDVAGVLSVRTGFLARGERSGALRSCITALIAAGGGVMADRDPPLFSRGAVGIVG